MMTKDVMMISSDQGTFSRAAYTHLLDDRTSNECIVQMFLSRMVNLDSQEFQKEINQSTLDRVVMKLFNALLHTPLEIIPDLLTDVPCKTVFTTADIPQFSNMETAMYYIPRLLDESDSSLTYRELGMKIHPCKSLGAAAKYGENHAKVTMSIALAVPTKKDGFAAITKSAMTSAFCRLEQSEKSDVLQKLCYRIPIVQAVIKDDDWRSTLDTKIAFLSDSMIKRRRHCCVDLISYALGE